MRCKLFGSKRLNSQVKNTLIKANKPQPVNCAAQYLDKRNVFIIQIYKSRPVNGFA